MSRQQERLSDRAVREVRRRKYQRAAELLRAALERGSIDLLWLNLGRALFRSGDCEGARRAYDEVEGAPKQANIGSIVSKKLRQYRADIDRECPATLKLSCDFPELEFSLDDGAPLACGSGKRIQLRSGDHALRWGLGGDLSRSRSLTLRGGQLTEVTLPAPVNELLRAAYQALSAGQLTRSKQLMLFFEGRERGRAASALLGRIAFLEENCASAIELFHSASEARSTLENQEIEAALGTWRRESETRCPGQLTVQCNPAGIWIQLGDRELQSCPTSSLSLPPGRWNLRAFYERERLERAVEIEAMSPQSISLEMGQRRDPYLLWGSVSGALGVLALGGVLAVDQLVLAPEYERYRGYAQRGQRTAYLASQSYLSEMRALNLSLLVGGVLSLATSGTLFALRPTSFVAPIED